MVGRITDYSLITICHPELVEGSASGDFKIKTDLAIENSVRADPSTSSG